MSDDRFGRLFELIDDAVVDVEIVDNVPVVRAVNPAFVDVFGYDRETIVGESLNDFIVPDTLARRALSFDRRSADGEYNEATVARETATGIRQFQYRGVPYEHDGASHALAIYTDVTEQRRREQHHRVLHRVLRHTLRNKLTSILSPATAIRKGRSDDVAADAERIYAAATELEALSDAAGEVEQIMGTAHVDRERVDLVGLLDDIVESSRTAEAEAKIELDRPSSLPVAADYRVGIAIRNLVENALEHGGETPSVAVTGTRVDGEVVVTVTDDGPGIPEHVRSVVFGDRDVTQLDHGTGLGLWLTRWIVESYGGLLVYSRRGGETTVSIRLPTVDGGGEPGDRERRK